MYAQIGIKIHPCGVPFPLEMKVYVICACFDLPARASTLNMIQFNGYNGCNFCEQPGSSVKTKKGGSVHTFPYQLSSPKGPSRTQTSYTNHAKEAISQKSVVRYNESKIYNT